MFVVSTLAIISTFLRANRNALAKVLPVFAIALSWTMTEASAACVGKTMNIVAHQDDDVIFFGAAEIADIQAGRCVQTIFTTAGDLPGEGIAYWYSRERGADAAHASMAGVARGTTDSYVLVDGKRIPIHTLIGNPNVTMIYLRLPAENATADLGTLSRDEGSVSTVPDAHFDGSSVRTYTKATLGSTLLVLMNRFKPDKVRIQDHATGDGDHNDHVFTARFALAAATSYAATRGIEVADLVTAYVGYRTHKLPQNETGSPRVAKFQAFRAYGAFDHNSVCENRDCSSFHTYGFGTDWFGYSRWMSRQYTLVDEPTGPVSEHFEIRGLLEKCIDVESASTVDGTPVQIWECVNADWQKWKYDSAKKTFSGLDSGKCLTILNPVPVNGTAVGISTCADAPTQAWTLTRDGELIGLGNLCLDLPSNQAVNGTNLTVKDCKYVERQLWGYGEPAPVLAPVHVLRGVGKKCLNAEPAALLAEGAVTIRACTGITTLNQQWRFTPSHRLRGIDGKCATIAIPGEIGTDGKDIVLKPCSGSTDASQAERWVPVANEAKSKVMNDGTGKCFALRGGATVDGTVVESSACVTAASQNWVVKPNFPFPWYE